MNPMKRLFAIKRQFESPQKISGPQGTLWPFSLFTAKPTTGIFPL